MALVVDTVYPCVFSETEQVQSKSDLRHFCFVFNEILYAEVKRMDNATKHYLSLNLSLRLSARELDNQLRSKFDYV
jgi:hypothetical protein